MQQNAKQFQSMFSHNAALSLREWVWSQTVQSTYRLYQLPCVVCVCVCVTTDSGSIFLCLSVLACKTGIKVACLLGVARFADFRHVTRLLWSWHVRKAHGQTPRLEGRPLGDILNQA